MYKLQNLITRVGVPHNLPKGPRYRMTKEGIKQQMGFITLPKKDTFEKPDYFTEEHFVPQTMHFL